jgi:hypothetical protein
MKADLHILQMKMEVRFLPGMDIHSTEPPWLKLIPVIEDTIGAQIEYLQPLILILYAIYLSCIPPKLFSIAPTAAGSYLPVMH